MRCRYLVAVWLLISPWAADATQPLVTDDTAVQGKGHWQLEAGLQQSASQPDAGVQRTWSATLTRGLTGQTDAYVSTPYTDTTGGGSGWGDTELGLKLRLAGQGPTGLALKPRLMLPTGDPQRGLGTGRVGAGALLVAQADVGPVTLLANAGLGYQPNGQHQRQWLWRISGAALWHATDKLQLAVDAVLARNADPNVSTTPASLIAGVVYTPQPWLDLDAGYYHRLNRPAGPHAVMAGLTVRW